MDRSQLNYLLKKYNIDPRRENGQNFLINDEIVEKLITSAEVNENDTILEIGAGLGAVTAELCKKAKRVVAIEMDRDFIFVLNNLKKANKNLEITNNDVFKVDFDALKLNNFKLVANLPFNKTSLIFRHFLEKGPRPQSISVLIQKEVAQRITAKPGEMSILSVSVQLFGEPKIEKIVSRNNFVPKPNVDCAILSIKNIEKPQKIANIRDFFGFVRGGFSAKRKKLANNIMNSSQIEREIVEEGLKKLGFSENVRAQELSIQDWVRTFDHFRKNVI